VSVVAYPNQTSSRGRHPCSNASRAAPLRGRPAVCRASAVGSARPSLWLLGVRSAADRPDGVRGIAAITYTVSRRSLKRFWCLVRTVVLRSTRNLARSAMLLT
jgi:hypothetical protein